jgi:hypothetical protein
MMIRRFGVLVAAVAMLSVASASAQQAVTGTVTRIDPAANVVVLDNGQMLQIVPNTVILSNNQSMPFDTLTPGTAVVIQSGQPVMFEEGRYVAITEGAPTGVTAPSALTLTPPPPAAPPSSSVPLAPIARSQSGTYEVAGTVLRADPTDHVIVFDDGRHVWLDRDTQVLANGQEVQLSTLRGGTPVVVRSSRPIAARDGRAMMQEVASGTVVRIDPPAAIVLSDGRTIQTTSDQVVYVGDQPVAVSSLQPGSQVVVYATGGSSPAASPASPGAGVRQFENEHQFP